ncbi:M48 family metallopeptidase [Altererythrobacter sp. KTW20L]|uniref:M48 family metallopeptidase n=1 Tax=Altererythrobacter sp. KTW20L TaxID=2942210 RepID=UPI0020BE88F2|nr:YgjP-like metallopeptidase domain-containing protein [Altererythrobacter sp. KTW20L]MCL6250381.1 M48 family metallopeptidase [Altererythrobacter sp. KTW20L]
MSLDWLRREAAEPVLQLAGGELPVTIRRHTRATRLTMRLAPDGSEVRITLPRWGSTRDAMAFAQERAGWVEAQLARIPQALHIAPGSRVPYRGQDLLVDWQEKAPRRPRMADDRITLGGPQDNLAPRLQRWLEREALALLADDLAFYCSRAGEDQPQLRLSRAQRRWGSCTGERKTGRCIRINWRLVMAPDHVRRSVVAHEVAHLVHFDHSPAFHALLGELYEDDIKAADLWLKREGRRLYAAFG